MSKFKVGDAVIIKPTIGNTNEVCKVVKIEAVNTMVGGSLFYLYYLSNGNTYADYHIELWNPKTDLGNGYSSVPKNGLLFYDSYLIYQRIAECAYYLWLNGSDDTEQNWLNAEKLIKY